MASKISKILSAYENAYYMKPYRNVKIYPSILTKKKNFTPEEKKNLTRKGFRWYVYFDYLNPKTGKFERQAPVTEKINRNFPDFDDRFEAIKLLKSDVLAILKEGYNPYDKANAEDYTIIEAVQFALEEKKKENIGSRTISGYEKSVNKFKEWIKATGKTNTSISKVENTLISKFLASLKVSNRTKNNYRGDLSAVFKVLVKQGYLTLNPIENVDKEKTKPQIDFNYSEKEFEEIISYLEKEDRILLMFIKLVSFQFWRPKENCRIKVKDVNLDQRTVKAFTKQGVNKTKLIPNILYNDLESYLDGAKPEDLIFTPEGPGEWERDLDGRRSYFTLKFSRTRKSQGWNPKITIYDFRHYYTTKAFRNILNEVGNEDKTLEVLMKMTGHSTIAAIRKYIHDRDISLPEDYSKYLR